MYTSETQVRVRYAETDPMGYVYYGNYAQYYEVGRVEALRKLGLSYKELEGQGFALPVLTYSVKYFKPAFYDDLITIKTTIAEMPSVRIHFVYETFNQQGTLLNKAETVLVFFDKKKNKPCVAPKEFLEKMKRYFAD